MKKLHPLFLGCFVTMLLVICSCEIKDNTPCTARYTYHYLEAYEKEASPYLSDLYYDTVMFKTSSGDTLAFTLLQNDSGWYIEDESYKYPDGCADLHYYEKHDSRFLAFEGTGRFNSVIAGKSPERIVSTITYSLNECLSSFTPLTFGNTNSVNYIGNKNVNGLDYDDVFYTQDRKNPQVLHYFNKKHGLLLIEDKDKNPLYAKINR